MADEDRPGMKIPDSQKEAAEKVSEKHTKRV